MSDIVIRENSVTHLTTQLDFILLDASSSMLNKWWPMLGAVDTYVAQLRTRGIASHIRLDTFNSRHLENTVRDCAIAAWPPSFMTSPIHGPGGFTPLYDAIVIMARNIRDLNPVHGCAVTIVTDGDEYGSTFATVDQARATLDWLRAQGYPVTFIGCDFDNMAQARALGANASNSIGVQKHLLGQAAETYAAKRAEQAKSGGDINFTRDEQVKFGGLLGHG